MAADDKPQIEFIDRYSVFGPPNGCKGDCEGTGFIPWREPTGKPDVDARMGGVESVAHLRDIKAPIYRVIWYLVEAKQATDDGYHFIPCPQCKPDDPLVVLARRFMEGK
jgi:hypothetical protein